MTASWTQIDAAGPAQIVADLTPIKGWHIYWLNPGDSGLPTTFEVRQSERVLRHDVRMPAPQRFVSPGAIVTYGYEGSTLFFVRPHSLQPALETQVRADWLACAEICIKGSKIITLKPFSTTAVTTTTRQLKAWKRLPKPRIMPWTRTASSLVFEAKKGSVVALFPHADLQLRLDGDSGPYCRKNRCEIPLSVLTSSAKQQPLRATLSVATSTITQAFDMDLHQGIKP